MVIVLLASIYIFPLSSPFTKSLTCCSNFHLFEIKKLLRKMKQLERLIRFHYLEYWGQIRTMYSSKWQLHWTVLRIPYSYNHFTMREYWDSFHSSEKVSIFLPEFSLMRPTKYLINKERTFFVIYKKKDLLFLFRWKSLSLSLASFFDSLFY